LYSLKNVLKNEIDLRLDVKNWEFVRQLWCSIKPI